MIHTVLRPRNTVFYLSVRNSIRESYRKLKIDFNIRITTDNLRGFRITFH